MDLIQYMKDNNIQATHVLSVFFTYEGKTATFADLQSKVENPKHAFLRLQLDHDSTKYSICFNYQFYDMLSKEKCEMRFRCFIHPVSHEVIFFIRSGYNEQMLQMIVRKWLEEELKTLNQELDNKVTIQSLLFKNLSYTIDVSTGQESSIVSI